MTETTEEVSNGHIMWRLILLALISSLLLTGGLGFGFYQGLKKEIPDIQKLSDWRPLLITEVYDRQGRKVGEFFHQRRKIIRLEDIPQTVKWAFIAAEDAEFYQHKGIHWPSVLRAFWANLKAGEKVQGASTITQQLVKTLFLTPEKTFARKLKEMLLAAQLEKHLTKDEILMMYLNQIYFGQNSYGLEMAAETFFRKSVKELNLAEAALLAGLPKAPSRFNPLKNPKKAKERQLYVLKRMVETGYITPEESKKWAQMPIRIYARESFIPTAHYPVETARLLLLKTIPEDQLLTQGYQVQLTIDKDIQEKVMKILDLRLREIDKRQGFRGPIQTLNSRQEIRDFLEKTFLQLSSQSVDSRVLNPDGSLSHVRPFESDYSIPKRGLPDYLKPNQVVDGVVLEVDDTKGIVTVQVAEVLGLLDIESNRWAYPAQSEQRTTLNRWSTILKPGDVIKVRFLGLASQNQGLQRKFKAASWLSHYAYFQLEQTPLVQAGVLILDNQTSEVIAMAGGRDFYESPFNRVLQAKRQAGSSFKVFVYLAALENGYSPFTQVLDAPLVFEDQKNSPLEEWRPSNYSREFFGEIPLRLALIRSLNIPAVRVSQDIGLEPILEITERLGFLSPLNRDFTLALGSSSVTPFEMTKAFAIIARMGKAVDPRIIVKVVDSGGQPVDQVSISLNDWFGNTYYDWMKNIQEKREKFLSARAKNPELKSYLYFDDPDQWLRPETCYVLIDMLKGVLRDPNGTGARFASLLPHIELAGKTGTTNNYNDGWFVGASPLYTVGVWVGFDQEASLGPQEVASRTALPIWADIMAELHKSTNDPIAFPRPEMIKVLPMDPLTGLPSNGNRKAILQAFRPEDLEKWDKTSSQSNPDLTPHEEFE